MSGGKGMINGEDGVKFETGNKAAEKWTENEALRFGNDLLDWIKTEDENIFFEDFIYLQNHEDKNYAGKITPQTISYLKNKFSSFSNLLEIAKKIEEIKIKKYSSFDKLNPTISKFLLSAQFGYTERKDVTTNGESLNVPILNIDPLSDENDNGTSKNI